MLPKLPERLPNLALADVALPDRPTKGRGAVSNRTGRFESQERIAVDDGWIRATIDGVQLFSVQDVDPLASGGVALVVEDGCLSSEAVHIAPNVAPYADPIDSIVRSLA